jgi:rubredoxin-NAD+ reductase
VAEWECQICGHIYDEAKGDPDHGIPPGTLWKDVPDTWTCPGCGVGKDRYEPIDTSSQSVV